MDMSSAEPEARPTKENATRSGLRESVNMSNNVHNDHEIVNEILQNVHDEDLRGKLSKLIAEKNRALEEFRNAYHCARNDAIEARDRLNKVESELIDTRSAAALANEYHNDAIQTMKRRQAEELASLRVISEQFHNECKSSEQPNEYLKAVNQNTTTVTSQSDRRPSQNFTNQALDRVEKMARRVGLKGLGNIKASNSTQEFSPGREKIEEHAEPHELEIKYLKQAVTDDGITLPPSLSPPDSPNCLVDSAPHSNDPASNHTSKSNHSSLPNTTNSFNLMNSSLATSPSSQTSDTVQLTAQLVDSTNEIKELKSSLDLKTKELKLALERQDELENKLKTQTTEQAGKIRNLESTITKLEKHLESMKSNYQTHRDAVAAEISTLIQEREDCEDKFGRLRSHYDALLGRRSEAAALLSDQPILLPEDRSDLELFALRLREENISFRVAREHLEERLESDTQSYKQQILAEQQERTTLEAMLQMEIQELKSKLSTLTDAAKERDQEISRRQALQEDYKALQLKFSDVQSKYETAESSLVEIREQKANLQQQVIQLQSDLNNAESVQADFVHLSQSLQIQLEKFRQQEEKVRWVHPDDASNCSSCQSRFPTGPYSNPHKVNCSHCGQIFCSTCLKKTMSTGPHNRLVPVCDVCHTLLNKHAAPYFSTSSLRIPKEYSDSPRRVSLPTSPPQKSSSNISNKQQT